MKLLLIGNHTCGNRGDAAILRGLLSELREHDPDISVDIYSRYPVSSSYILNEKISMDPLEQYHEYAPSFKDKLIKRYTRRFLSYLLAWKMKQGNTNNLPELVLKQIENIKNYDAVIQVGGSNFVSMYGPFQFENALCVLLAKKKLFLIGHSVGPFHSKNYSKLANFVFSRVELLALREEISLKLMRKANISDSKVMKGSDTAWLVPNKLVKIPQHLDDLFNSKPVIAITLRELAPFDKQLGVTQAEYEQKVAELVTELTQKGYKIVFCSTGTGIDSYWRDDRMIALKVQALVSSSDCYVIMDELNDVEIGSFLNKCILTIGTRLHSAIISMNFDTPAIAINYEHKSKGIMAQLDMPELSKDVSSLFDGELLKATEVVLSNIETVTEQMRVKVEQERQLGKVMIKQVIENIKSSL